MFPLRAIAVLIMSVGATAVVALFIPARTAARPDRLGVKGGRLAPCPSSPNRVSSQSDDPAGFIEPERKKENR